MKFTKIFMLLCIPLFIQQLLSKNGITEKPNKFNYKDYKKKNNPQNNNSYNQNNQNGITVQPTSFVFNQNQQINTQKINTQQYQTYEKAFDEWQKIKAAKYFMQKSKNPVPPTPAPVPPAPVPPAPVPPAPVPPAPIQNPAATIIRWGANQSIIQIATTNPEQEYNDLMAKLESLRNGTNYDLCIFYVVNVSPMGNIMYTKFSSNEYYNQFKTISNISKAKIVEIVITNQSLADYMAQRLPQLQYAHNFKKPHDTANNYILGIRYSTQRGLYLENPWAFANIVNSQTSPQDYENTSIPGHFMNIKDYYNMWQNQIL